jgi:hypothetical protein
MQNQKTPMRLRLVPRSADLVIRADGEAERPYSASFQGPEPTIREDSDGVTVEYPRFRAALPTRRSRGELRLNPAFAWEISVEGGVSKLDADLSGLSLRSFAIAGGASDVRVELPEPADVVPVRFAGGASEVALRRPRGVSARLRIAGGASNLTFDHERHGAVGGETRLASAGAEGATERYDIDVDGGASKLSVTEAK